MNKFFKGFLNSSTPLSKFVMQYEKNIWVKYVFCDIEIFELNMFLVPINMSFFRFSPFKKFLQLLVPQKIFIFTFGPSFKVNSYIEFIFLNKILQKNS